MRVLRSAGAFTLMSAFAVAAFGQAGTGFTITDGTTIYTQGTSPTVPTSTGVTPVDFRVGGGASPDQLFGNWWWYRVDGVDARENAFNNQVGPTVVAGDIAVRNYAFPSFTASLTYDVDQLGAGSGRVVETLVITPLTAGNLNIFNYVDYFLNGQDANDIVDFAGPGLQRARDTVSGTPMIFEGLGAVNYQAAPFNTIRAPLTDADIDNLNNTNTANTAGDREGAFQWIIPMVPGQPITIVEIITVPEPASFGLLALGALAFFRRR